MPNDLPRPTPAAAVVALREDRVLLIRRGRPPNAEIWSFPGGSIEPGETVREAAVRECLEETGIPVEILDVLDVVDVILPATPDHAAYHYVITDFLARPLADTPPRPGDDAAEARWVPLTDLDGYALTPAMSAVLTRALDHLARTAATAEEPAHHARTPERPNAQRPTPNAAPSTLRTLGEFPLIEILSRLVQSTSGRPESGDVILAIGDDAAVLAPHAGARVIATIDTLIEGIHFRRDWTSPEDLGWKSLAVNVSDAAAMGAAPWAALISLALPPETPVEWVEALYRGLQACALQYGCAIVGGDTVGSRHDVAITVALLGTALPGEIRRRDGAHPGDLVCVTGTLGDSGAGLALLQVGRRPEEVPQWQSLLQAHLRPSPPLAAARALAQIPAVTAMMDLSDGLASDLVHLCHRSNLGARVHAACIPISETVRSAAAALAHDPLDWALRGGEDYQLLFTLAPEAADALAETLRDTGVTASVVGEMTPSGYTLVHAHGREESLSPTAFDHFGG